MNSWIIILGIAPFLIGMSGQVARSAVLGDKKPAKSLKGWRRVYHATLPMHALSVGAAIGIAGYKFGAPVPSVFGEEIAGSVLAYTLSGGVSVIGYDVIVKTLRRMLESYGQKKI